MKIVPEDRSTGESIRGVHGVARRRGGQNPGRRHARLLSRAAREEDASRRRRAARLATDVLADTPLKKSTPASDHEPASSATSARGWRMGPVLIAAHGASGDGHLLDAVSLLDPLRTIACPAHHVAERPCKAPFRWGWGALASRTTGCRRCRSRASAMPTVAAIVGQSG